MRRTERAFKSAWSMKTTLASAFGLLTVIVIVVSSSISIIASLGTQPAELTAGQNLIAQDAGAVIATTALTALALAAASGAAGFIIARSLSAPLVRLARSAVVISGGDTRHEAESSGAKEIRAVAAALNTLNARLREKSENSQAANAILGEIVTESKTIVYNLNSSAKEIEAAAQEQTTAANEHASGVTEVSATLQELSATAKQITHNVDELMLSSEAASNALTENQQRLLETVSQLQEAGAISQTNAAAIHELGKRSLIINDMVELIKEVANKTNILSINASIEASRSGETGSGFSVVAAEIRELSKETIESAKKADRAAKEIIRFLETIIASTKTESEKVIESGKIVTDASGSMADISARIENNYSFTQKIDVSIKQQEAGSVQAAETMKQMAEISRQSAETARQTLATVKNIVTLAVGLEKIIGQAGRDDRPAAPDAGRSNG